MNSTRTSIFLGIILGLGVSPALGADKVTEKPVIPPDFRSTAPAIPADQNNLTPFLTTLGNGSPELMKQVREARDQLATGKPVTDMHLLQKLREQHKQADDLLRPPLVFTSDSPASATLPMYFLFQGTAVLARQAVLENDYPLADHMIADMLRWSHLLRNAQPNEMQYALARGGWQTAFDTLLKSWRNHPDQNKRLREIETLFQNNQIEVAEIIETKKSEARWWINLGGVRKMLSGDTYAGIAAFVLKPPFNELPNERLLELPYDTEADFRRFNDEMRETLDRIRTGQPLCKWPGFKVPTNRRAFTDYQKLPNGLGDLFYEKRNPEITNSFWASALSSSPLLEACLIWLKLEEDGRPIIQSDFDRLLDPVDGKPMIIDVKSRTIHTRGMNQKVDAPDEAEVPLPAAGFAMVGDDAVMVVPKWR